MKKILSTLLSLMMILGMVSFAGAEGYNMPEMNTTDEFTLTFMTWDDFEITEALAAKFMEKYPNITVEILRTTTSDIAGELQNRAADNDLPDVYFWLDLEPLMTGKFMYDITEYIENDEEAQTLLYDTLKKVGYLDGKRCYFMAGEFLPATVYCDANVFEQMNVELPSQDWKWEEMLDLIDKLADPTQGFWGYFNGMYGLVTGGPIALTDNASSPFAAASDIRLYANSDMVSFVDSLVAPMSVINALIVAVAERKRDTLAQTFSYLEQLWSEYEVFTTDKS